MSESQKTEGTLDEATSMKLLSMPVGVLVQWYAGKESHNKPFAFRVPCGDGRFVLVAVKLEDVK